MKHIIRTTDRGTYKKCRTLWDFISKMRQDYEPNTTNRQLELGTGIHAGMQVYYNPDTWHLRSNPTTAKVLLANVIAAFRNAFPHPVNQYGEKETDYEILKKYKADCELGPAILTRYHDYSMANDNFKPVFTEIEFEVEITNKDGTPFLCSCHNWPVFYQGRLDLLIEDEYGGYWIVDHKKRDKFGNFDWLDLDPQGLSYCWAIQYKLGIRISGMIYNELRGAVPMPPKRLKDAKDGTPKLSQDKSQETTYLLYKQALDGLGLSVVGYEDFLEWLKINEKPYFRRIQIQHSQREYEIASDNVLAEAREMIDPNLTIYPNPTMLNCNSCVARMPCQAKHDGSDYQDILEALFHKREKANGN